MLMKHCCMCTTNSLCCWGHLTIKVLARVYLWGFVIVNDQQKMFSNGIVELKKKIHIVQG